MNRGLIIRAFRESWSTTLVMSLVLMGFAAAIAFVLGKFGDQFSREWMNVHFARNIMEAMLGTKFTSVGPVIFHAVPWVHPVVLAVTWAHALVSCTRVPVGEVDRGTADVLLGLPVSRCDVFLSETIVWLFCGFVLLAAALAGYMTGNLVLPAGDRPGLPVLLPVLLNLFCVYIAVGGLAWLLSSLSDRRGRALTIGFLVLLVLFLLNYLTQFWQPLQKFAFLSPLHYHRPVHVLAGGAWPWTDMGILTAVGGLLWLAGGVVFVRRDLCTV